MKALIKPMLAVGLAFAASAPLLAAPAATQLVKGVGVIDPDLIISSSSAYKTAESQRPVTFKQYYDQAKTRSDQINAQIKPLVDKFEADRKAPNPNKASLAQQANTIQEIGQQGQSELSQILQPVSFSQDYVDEQINAVLPKAIDTVATKKSISLILNRATGAVVYRDPAYNLNDDVIAELNGLLPVAQLVPPPGWMPREMRERLARQNGGDAAAPDAAGAAAPATTPAGPPAESR